MSKKKAPAPANTPVSSFPTGGITVTKLDASGAPLATPSSASGGRAGAAVKSVMGHYMDQMGINDSPAYQSMGIKRKRQPPVDPYAGQVSQ